MTMEKNKAAAKGFDRNFVKQKMGHDRYKSCWQNCTNEAVNFYNIQSKNHVLRTVLITKEGLNCMDTKRYICKDNTSTYAFGHYMIRNNAKL